ncbi:MAG: DNA repair protein RecN [Bacteroidetes bacterium]|nr:DNA repair protein RecN [Bacteroidota bacterium]
MLTRLSIRNYLLIDELELELEKGFTAITGETGSGKSILIGALGLVMGERADGVLARDPARRCVIELEVEAKGLDLEPWCEANGVPYETPLLLRRQLDPAAVGKPGGRSRAFVNDTPVRLEQLRELGGRLVHVHSQHHTLLLNDPAFQLGLLDHFAGRTADVRTYGERFRTWRKQHEELVALRAEEARAQGEADYLRFQLEELDGAQLVTDEQPALEQALARADHAEELAQAYRTVEEAVSGDQGMLGALATLKQRLVRAARIDAGLAALAERLTTAAIDLKDIAAEAERLGAHVSIDPREAERLRERLDTLLRLQQKHRVRDVEALIALRDDLRGRTARIGSLSTGIARLEADEQALRADLQARAAAISAERMRAAVPLAQQVSALLKDLGMPHAVFTFAHATGELQASGIDAVRALFSANKDRAPAALDKVASGGELSRVMLALISLAAESKALPTVLFDEIDTGVSGETAHRVGILMARMAKDRQVIAITHLPQIASKAGTHLLVTKDHAAEHVHSDIRPLDAEERVEALARMLSGKKPTKAAVENARELLKGR